MDKYIEVHCSSLGTGTDCTRNWSISLLSAEQKENYGIAETRPSIALPMGNGLHKVMAQLYRFKQNTGGMHWSAIDDALESIWPTFLKEIAEAQEKHPEGVRWDKVTGSEEDARVQLQAMAERMVETAQYVEPLAIEQKFEKLVSPLGEYAMPVKLVGTTDAIDNRGRNYTVEDHKSGARFPECQAQGGGYIILANYSDIPANGFRMNWTARKKKVSEIVRRTVTFDADVCVKQAWEAIKDIQRQAEAYYKSGQSPDSFRANPRSQICSANYCHAFGSAYCRLGCLAKGRESE